MGRFRAVAMLNFFDQETIGQDRMLRFGLQVKIKFGAYVRQVNAGQPVTRTFRFMIGDGVPSLPGVGFVRLKGFRFRGSGFTMPRFPTLQSI